MKPSDDHWHNRAAWDRLAKKQDRLAKPARDVDFANPLRSVDGPGWLGGDIRGQRVLCLAAGGGRQGPIYAAAGAIVTVVDISPAMLELDRAVAAERKIDLRTIEASMDNLAMLGDGSFDLVIHPVSTCYVPSVLPVYREVARVLVAGGLYISQHKQPASLQASLEADRGAYRLETSYYEPESTQSNDSVSGVVDAKSAQHSPLGQRATRKQPLPPATKPNLIREEGTLEYVHRWEELLGFMCRCGLVIEDLTEPRHGRADALGDSFAHRSQFLAPYVRVKARKLGAKATSLII